MYKKGKMNALSVVAFFLIVCLADSVTDISLLNCPSSYLKSSPVQSETGFVDFGENLYAAYQTDSNKQSLYKIIVQGDANQFASHSKTLQVPYIILAVIFLIVMVFVILWCIFSRSCPPWQWTKRDPFLNPYTKKQMRYTLVWLLIFAAIILILSVLILSQIPNLKMNMQQTKCSIFVTIDTVLNGGTPGWNGFQQLKNNVGNISSLISSTTTQMGLYFTGDDWLQDDMTRMKTKNNVIYRENKDAQLVSPNPFITAIQIQAGFSAPLIDSLFIKRGLGPVGQVNRMTTWIQQALNVTQKLSSQAYLIDRSARLLDDSSETIKQNFVMAQNTLNMYIHQLQVYLVYFKSIVDSYFTSDFSTFLYAIQIVMTICLVSTMLILIGAFSTATFHILDCRKMVHIGWIIYSCSFLGGLVLIYLFIGLGSIGYGFCEYYKGLLTGQEVFQNIKSENSQNILNKLDVCLYGDGNALQSFGVADQIKTLQRLFVDIKTYDEYTNVSSGNYVNTTFSLKTLQKWIDIIQKYKQGIYVDSNPLQTNQDNPNYSLDQLNLYSNTGGGVPTCSKDRWVFDRKNCTNPQITYNTTDLTNGTSFTTDNVLCISLNEGLALQPDGTFTKWTQQNFTRRYVSIRQSCSSAYTNIMKFGNVLIDYRNSRINLFQGIQDNLNQILSQNQDFNQLLTNFRSRVTQFSDSTKTLRNLIISESKGIKFTANCSVIGQKFKDTHTVFCRNFMSQIVRMGLLSLFLTIIIAFGIWTGSLFAVRYSQIQKHQRLNMPDSEADSQRIISDKKSDESD